MTRPQQDMPNHNNELVVSINNGRLWYEIGRTTPLPHTSIYCSTLSELIFMRCRQDKPAKHIRGGVSWEMQAQPPLYTSPRPAESTLPRRKPRFVKTEQEGHSPRLNLLIYWHSCNNMQTNSQS